MNTLRSTNYLFVIAILSDLGLLSDVKLMDNSNYENFEFTVVCEHSIRFEFHYAKFNFS